jgi:hypothetical protein
VAHFVTIEKTDRQTFTAAHRDSDAADGTIGFGQVAKQPAIFDNGRLASDPGNCRYRGQQSFRRLLLATTDRLQYQRHIVHDNHRK